MPKKGDIYLGEFGSEILLSAFGRKLTISDEQINREGRTANGTFLRDVIATKKSITLDHTLLGGTDLATFLSMYNLNTTLSLQIYHTDDAGTTTAGPEINYDQYNVLMSPITRTRELLASDGLWADVKIVLKEI